MSTEPTDIRVSERILRFGDKNVPLHTITRAVAAELAPDRRAVVQTYAVTVARWLIPAAVVSALTPEAVSAVVKLGALTWFAISTARLAGNLRLRLHELVVETTTGSHRILVSTDAKAVADVAFLITDAIHDPAREFHVRAETSGGLTTGPSSAITRQPDRPMP